MQSRERELAYRSEPPQPPPYPSGRGGGERGEGYGGGAPLPSLQGLRKIRAQGNRARMPQDRRSTRFPRGCMANWLRRLLGASSEEPDHAEQIRELANRTRELERWLKEHELMHDEWYGKMRRVLARINRAAKHDDGDDSLSDGDQITGQRRDSSPISVTEAKARLGMMR